MALADYFLYFIYAFASIFVIVNPVEGTMVFISLTSGMSGEEKKRIYRRTTLVAFFVALLFAVAGDLVLRFFGITVDSLRVAGGILLFLVAIDMLRSGRHYRKVTEAELRDASDREDISVFPLATPLLTGPGTITTVIVLMGAAATLTQKATVLLAISLTFLAAYYILKFSEYIDRVLGITGIMVMTRIMGLLLGAIAVNFVAVGTWNLYQAMVGG
ncbi:MAG: NAAT family transporter [Methanotrichaceae archaeon]|nr:NAAT family transporter [Methanotrichaceae archaeon]